MMQKPRKRFGQHFLCDQTVIRRIVAALAPQPKEHLVEIGPGQGAITLPILKIMHRLEAIEFDRDLVAYLQQYHRDHNELIVYQADVLEFDFMQLKTDERLLRVFGNLPYNISTPLIFHLLTFTSIISDMLFMLQKEVAERLAAQVNAEHYGRLSVMVQYHCVVELLFDVANTAFFPPPQVQSSVVKLIPRKRQQLAHNYAHFAAVVKSAFNFRRKTLRNSLRNLVTIEDWRALDIDPTWRAENLSVDDFIAMSNQLSARNL